MSDRDRLSAAAAAATALATAALFALFQGGRWLPAVLGAVLVVAAASMLARRLRLPVPLQPLFTAGAATVYVTAVFAHGTAVLGMFPGPRALRALGDLARTGFDDISQLATPVPTNRGMVLIAVAGIAGVALVTDMVAATVRRPPLAGLPLLALFAVPASVAPHGVGLVPFVAGVAGYLILLAADHRDRLYRWGSRLRTAGQFDQAGRFAAASYGEESVTGTMGRRIGTAAIVCAVIVPALIPTLRPSVFTGNGSGGSGNGSGGVTTYNPIVNIRDQLTATRAIPVVRLRTDDLSPVRYLRLAGLDRFDGDTWSQSPLRAGSESRVDRGGLPPVQVTGDTADTQIDVLDQLDARWLPLPYQPTTITVEGDWRFDQRTGSIFSTSDSARGQSVRVNSVELSSDINRKLRKSPAVKGGTALDADLQLPSGLPGKIVTTARQITESANTPFDRALALQAYFRTNFTYSLRVPKGNGDDAILDFLSGRQGFCEQFAATMAVFARVNSIPARVAVGFTYGELANGTYQITTRDAHAWPELYFTGIGWLPFEPTPVAGQQTATVPSYSVPNAGGPSGPDKTGPTGQAGSLVDKKFRIDAPEGVGGTSLGPINQPTPTTKRPHRRSPLPYEVAGIALLVLLVAPGVTRAVVRRRRWHVGRTPLARAHAAWAELRDVATDHGLAWPASASPRGAQAWLTHRAKLDGGPAMVALRALSTAEERARYARPGSAADWSTDLRRQVATVRTALAAAVSTRARWQARLMPASSLERGARLGNRMAEALDRAERAVIRPIRRLFSRRVAGRSA